MNAQQLRAAILQQAIEGKLVPQLDSEPAVEQIGEAPEDVPFEIPEKWKWVALGSVCVHVQRGKSPKYSDIQEIPVVAQKCNQWDGFHIEKAKFIDPESLKSYKEERILQDKDVLWNSTGLGTLGRTAIYLSKLNPYKCAVADSHVTVIRTDKEILDPSYLYYYICNPSVQRVIESQSDGSTKQKELATSTIKAYPLPLPPLEEQRRIVAKLEELLPLVEEYGKSQDALDKMNAEFGDKLRASILQEAIQGKLVPQLDEEPAVEQISEAPEDVPFAIPEKWKWVQLSSVGKIVGGGTPKTAVDEYWTDGTVAWITPADLGKNNSKFIARGAKFITKKGLTSSSARLMPKGSIVYSSRAPIGHIAIADNELCTNQGCKSLVPTETMITSDWAYYVMIARTPDIQSRASGTTFKEISGKGVGETYIPLPSLSEQRRIVAKIEELFQEVEKISR